MGFATICYINMPHVVVVGAGISGLVAAFTLQKQGVDVTVYESDSRPGGVIQSVRADGYLVEVGPNSIQAKTPLLFELSKELGIEAARCEATREAARRYIVRGSTPVAMPSGPPGFLSTKLFSASGKLRILREPFIRPAPPGAEESVAEFVRRRLGREMLDYAINPFVAGVYAGDPRELSLRHAFPRLHEIEQEHGSLIRGMIALSRQRKAATSPMPAGRLFSYVDGIETLPVALADHLGTSYVPNTGVTSIVRNGSSWAVTHERGETLADAVLYAGPLHRFHDLKFAASASTKAFGEVRYPSLWTVALGFRREDVSHPLDGFGMLVPEVESRFRILGTLFSSTLFPARAPEGHVLFTTFIGGTRRPELGSADEATVLRTVREDLRALLGAFGEPAFVHTRHWDRAIPQYRVGYGAVKETIDRLETENPGFFMCGNYRRGISVSDAATSGAEAATAIASYLGKA